MKIITMTQTFNEVVYLTLSEENQIKVEHIYCIAATLHQYRLPRLSAREFDELYDKTTAELEQLSGLVRFRVQAAVYGPMALAINRKKNMENDDGN